MVLVYLLTNVGLNRLEVTIPKIMCQTRHAMCFARVFSPDGRSGVVPKELGNIKTLARLDISGNKLTSEPWNFMPMADTTIEGYRADRTTSRFAWRRSAQRRLQAPALIYAHKYII